MNELKYEAIHFEDSYCTTLSAVTLRVFFFVEAMTLTRNGMESFLWNAFIAPHAPVKISDLEKKFNKIVDRVCEGARALCVRCLNLVWAGVRIPANGEPPNLSLVDNPDGVSDREDDE